MTQWRPTGHLSRRDKFALWCFGFIYRRLGDTVPRRLRFATAIVRSARYECQATDEQIDEWARVMVALAEAKRQHPDNKDRRQKAAIQCLRRHFGDLPLRAWEIDSLNADALGEGDAA